jgi:hypothetical protein
VTTLQDAPEEWIGCTPDQLRETGIEGADELADLLDSLTPSPGEYESVRIAQLHALLGSRDMTLSDLWPPDVLCIEGPFTRYLVTYHDRATAFSSLAGVEAFALTAGRVPCPTAREKLIMKVMS